MQRRAAEPGPIAASNMDPASVEQRCGPHRVRDTRYRAMTDLPTLPVDVKAVLSGSSPTVAMDDHSEGMSYLQSVPRRLVTLYLPLSIIVIILLFPFYWMGLTSIKPDEQLIDLETYSPFW